MICSRRSPLAEDLDRILAHTSGVWDGLRGARIFLTGGTGFFGCWLVESFARAWDSLGLDASLTLLTRSAQAFRRKAPHLASHPGIELVEGDVRSFRLPGASFSHVIHAATEATPQLCREQPLLVLDTIVDGTRRTLECAVQARARRFLLISSGAVYGTQPPDLTHLPETYLGAPDLSDQRWVYGEGKRLAEMLCTIYSGQHPGMDCLVARCFAFVGPYMPLDAHFAVGNFIRDRLNGGPIQVNGDGSQFRSYLYASDLAVWLWAILDRGKSGRPYNVGSDQALTIAELAATVSTSLEPALPVKIAGTPAPGKPADRYVPSTERARAELNLRQLVPLDEALRRTAAFALEAQNQTLEAQNQIG